jgi:hypothetical protein
MRFPQDYTKEELAKLVIEHRDEAIRKGTLLTETREKLVKVSKELTALKKANREKK